ncbi:MAG TPA: hypothetical protein ENK57_21795 [Polyangiaceae bacterium]|nr:hypothetical protein [Polyangiaceae bacterium]
MSADSVLNVVIIVIALFNVVVAGPLAIYLRSLTSDLRALKEELDRDMARLDEQLQKFKDEVHVQYVRKTDYVNDIREIKQMLKELNAKLDRKADRA